MTSHGCNTRRLASDVANIDDEFVTAARDSDGNHATLLDELDRCIPAAPPRVREIARVLRDRLEREQYAEDESSRAEHNVVETAYRRGWNDATRSLLRSDS